MIETKCQWNIRSHQLVHPSINWSIPWIVWHCEDPSNSSSNESFYSLWSRFFQQYKKQFSQGSFLWARFLFDATIFFWDSTRWLNNLGKKILKIQHPKNSGPEMISKNGGWCPNIYPNKIRSDVTQDEIRSFGWGTFYDNIVQLVGFFLLTPPFSWRVTHLWVQNGSRIASASWSGCRFRFQISQGSKCLVNSIPEVIFNVYFFFRTFEVQFRDSKLSHGLPALPWNW